MDQLALSSAVQSVERTPDTAVSASPAQTSAAGTSKATEHSSRQKPLQRVAV